MLLLVLLAFDKLLPTEFHAFNESDLEMNNRMWQ